MFEKATDDRFDMDILREAGNARLQGADAAHHHADFDTRRARFVKLVDHAAIGDRVEFDPDA